MKSKVSKILKDFRDEKESFSDKISFIFKVFSGTER